MAHNLLKPYIRGMRVVLVADMSASSTDRWCHYFKTTHRGNKMKKQYGSLLAASLLTMAMATPATAGYLQGGDAADKASADVILDIAFAIDTSGSMSDEASGISTAMSRLVTQLNCPDCNVWVQASFYGIQSTWSGTLFNTALTGGTINSSEDNAPAVNNLISTNTAWQIGGALATQDYYRAIVTIGDEGSDNGEPGNLQSDYDAAYLANQAAINAGILLFTVVGNPNYGAGYTFPLMSEGGSGGGYTFGDAGGTNVFTTSNTLEADIEAIICTAAGGGTGTVPEPATMLLMGTGLAGLLVARRRKAASGK